MRKDERPLSIQTVLKFRVKPFTLLRRNVVSIHEDKIGLLECEAEVAIVLMAGHVEHWACGLLCLTEEIGIRALSDSEHGLAECDHLVDLINPP
jgi:hypothetical protein